MATISADMVKKLREQTGAGMMDCKKALGETNGDFEKAVTILREKGIAVAQKRETKQATEGIIGHYLSDDQKTGVLVELNCETTFVAKTEDFVDLAKKIAIQAAKENDVESTDDLLEKPLDGTNQKISEVINDVMGKVGEKMGIARFSKLSTDGVMGSYIHMGDQIGVLAELKLGNAASSSKPEVQELAKDLAMHISWSSPEYLTRDEVPQEEINKEKEINKQRALKEGKPENIVDKIVEGRMKEFYSRVCLMEQPFIKDESMTIEKLVADASKAAQDTITVGKFARLRVGETASESEGE